MYKCGTVATADTAPNYVIGPNFTNKTPFSVDNLPPNSKLFYSDNPPEDRNYDPYTICIYPICASNYRSEEHRTDGPCTDSLYGSRGLSSRVNRAVNSIYPHE